MLKKGYEVAELIQVAYESTNQDVEEREVKAFKNTSYEKRIFVD